MQMLLAGRQQLQMILVVLLLEQIIPIVAPPLLLVLPTGVEVAQQLAQAIVRDGEGATKFVAVKISGGTTERESLKVAYSIAESPLVKTAIFAEDANWGRFCMAIGKAGVRHLDTDKITLWLDDLVVAESGRISTEYSEEKGAAVLAQEEFSVRVDLGRGEANATIWTTDLSHEYIRINAEYRS